MDLVGSKVVQSTSEILSRRGREMKRSGYTRLKDSHVTAHLLFENKGHENFKVFDNSRLFLIY